MFENYGNFYECEDSDLHEDSPDSQWSFFGNFLTVSHVFKITSNDPAVVASLKRAIDANRQRKDYMDQPDPNAKTETYTEYCQAQ
jgi:hypothetical protein